MKNAHRFPLMILLVLLALQLSATAALSVEGPKKVEIKLCDGKVLEGVLRQIQASNYLMQTKDELYELSAQEIAFVDGKPGVPAGAGGRPLIVSTQRVQLMPDGSVVMWSEEEITNNRDEILTYAMFGAKEHELSFMRTLQAFDQFGNQLQVRIEPRAGTDLYNVFIDFEVPLLPGETMRGSLRHVFHDQIKQDGLRCRNEFWGDFPDDRLFTRRVELPVGAKPVKVEPEPNLQFEHLGQTVLVWRRYYPASTQFPLVVEYDLEK